MRMRLMAIALVAVFVLSVSAADTQPSDQHTGTISGKVLHNGKPMSGMRVAVYSIDHLKRGRKKSGAEERAGGAEKIFGKDRPKPVAQGLTNESGGFSFDVPAGSYVVGATGKKIGAAHERVEVKEGETAKVELQLQERPGGKKGKAAPEAPATQQS